jgi:N6-L-threonylcarbamoyladenine synthase
MKKATTILAIETSCDETAVAVLDCSGGLTKPTFKIRSNIVASQVKLHAEWGGVVPNLAKREHIKNLPSVLERALKKANIGNPTLEIDALAVTVGPGLEPALWTGITFAQELSQSWKLPIVASNHMEGHLAASLLDHTKRPTIIFPALALLVSGGHTELVYIKNWLKYKIIGETLDDAAGEAFDKVARMLELGYPGGPIISKLSRTGNRYAFSFPRPMINAKNFDFSFSGLKTSVLYTLRDLKENKTPFTKNDVAASFEDAVVDVLILKTLHASRKLHAKTILIGGGVAANALLRKRLGKAVALEKTAPKFIVPRLALTTDNAAMIAASAYFHVLKKDFTDWKKLEAHATMPL